MDSRSSPPKKIRGLTAASHNLIRDIFTSILAKMHKNMHCFANDYVVFLYVCQRIILI